MSFSHRTSQRKLVVALFAKIFSISITGSVNHTGVAQRIVFSRKKKEIEATKACAHSAEAPKP